MRTAGRLFDKGGTVPDGVVVENGVICWTTMGEPTKDPSAPDGGLDFSAPQRRRSPVWLDGTGARDVIPTGVITTGKQLTSDGAGTLYWGDREGCRVSRVRIDGTSLTDLVVNIRDDSWLQECVGVAVDTARGYLYWTQKGPSNGGKGRIFRAGLQAKGYVLEKDTAGFTPVKMFKVMLRTVERRTDTWFS